MTICSIPIVSIDVPTVPFLQLEYVGIANVWQCADSVFLLAFFESDKLLNRLCEICPVPKWSKLWSLTIDAKSKIVLIPSTLFSGSCV